MLANELADIVGLAVMNANLFGIDLQKALEKKMVKQAKMKAFNRDLSTQIYVLECVLQQSHIIQQIFNQADRLRLPNWYLGAGCYVRHDRQTE